MKMEVYGNCEAMGPSEVDKTKSNQTSWCFVDSSWKNTIVKRLNQIKHLVILSGVSC